MVQSNNRQSVGTNCTHTLPKELQAIVAATNHVAAIGIPNSSPPKEQLVDARNLAMADRPLTCTDANDLEAQSPVDVLLVKSLPLSQQRRFRTKFLGYFALHTLIVGCTASLLELIPALNKSLDESVLPNPYGRFCLFFVIALVLIWATAKDDEHPKQMRFIRLVLGSIALGADYAVIDVTTNSYGMLLNTCFMFVCVLLMTRISYISWRRPGDDKRLLEAMPAALIAYVITLAISVALFLSIGNNLLTMRGFCISMATQLVGVLIFSFIVHRVWATSQPDQAMRGLGLFYSMPILSILDRLL